MAVRSRHSHRLHRREILASASLSTADTAPQNDNLNAYPLRNARQRANALSQALYGKQVLAKSKGGQNHVRAKHSPDQVSKQCSGLNQPRLCDQRGLANASPLHPSLARPHALRHPARQRERALRGRNRNRAETARGRDERSLVQQVAVDALLDEQADGGVEPRDE
jgi:hypothetical protein